MIKTRTWRADGQLLLAAVIWGFAFVAQRVGMEHVGPFLFNALRFSLGALTLLPVLWLMNRFRNTAPARPKTASLVTGGLLAGLVLFAGATLQQVGMVYTTAGKAGFITGLYVVLIPLLGFVQGRRPHAGTCIGAGAAAVGLYLLSVTGDFTIARGDFLVFISAFFWAAHVLLIDRLTTYLDPLPLAFLQFSACAVLSFCAAFLWEKPMFSMSGILAAAPPILYSGFFSVGVAYTLQVVAQKEALPAHAAIILSLEAVFAAIGGWILLDEFLTLRGWIGCGLMLGGMLVSQLLLLKTPAPSRTSLSGDKVAL